MTSNIGKKLSALRCIRMGRTIIVSSLSLYLRWSPHTWPKRLYYSSFMNLLLGNNVNIDEIDEVINTLALVSCMVLSSITIRK